MMNRVKLEPPAMKMNPSTLCEIMARKQHVSIIHDILPLTERWIGEPLTEETICEIQETFEYMVREMYMFSDKYIICTPIFKVNQETGSLELTDIIYKTI